MLKMHPDDIEDLIKLNETKTCYRPLLIEIKKDDVSFFKLDYEVISDLSDYQLERLIGIFNKELCKRKEENAVSGI
jgi:hypothetical protein